MMCQSTDNYKFCTCSSLKELREKEYLWELTRYIKSEYSGIMGLIMMPVQDLGNGISVNNILKFLNSMSNPFDFDYMPKEKDCLEIRNKRTDYFMFIYENNKWKKGRNHPFSSVTKSIKKGFLKNKEN